MCVFLSWDFSYQVKCPVDKSRRIVHVQSFPHANGHFLEVVGCDAAPDNAKLSCTKACRDALEQGDLWREMEVGSAD
ncbi:MAG TPA: hypothetical protein VIB79_16720 [Candidatus Binatia bacterium]|jgi:hypothetical protein